MTTTLTSQQRDGIYAYVANILSESLNETRHPREVVALMSELTSVAQKAMSDVVEKWNLKARSVLCRLPPELLAQCFSWLVPRERAKVTTVSRYFRSVALAHPSLWAQIDFVSTTPRLEESLALLLERSGRAPLDVNVYSWSTGVTSLLAPQMPRIRTLTVNTTRSTSWIFEHPASLLEVLNIPERGDRDWLLTTLPPSTWAPPLRRLELPSVFILPEAGGPYNRVTHFSGYMTTTGRRDGPANTDAHTLFDVFPYLETLKLFFRNEDETTIEHMPNSPTPRTLMHLTLHADGDGSVIAPTLTLWRGHPFRTVHLFCRRTQLVTPILDHMRSVAPGPWHLELSGSARCIIKTETERVYNLYRDGDRVRFIHFRDDFDSLASITIPAHGVQDQLIETLRLPELHSITLRGPFPSTLFSLFSEGKLCVPRLQTLRLEPETLFDDKAGEEAEMKNCSRFGQGFLWCISLDDGVRLSKLPRLVLSTTVSQYVREKYWDWIYQRAVSVSIEGDLLYKA
ncbi:hypothetical protein EXIGLDRAFT_839780 [Exidia glandulosa HHB12029]|uniref:F-box domain-containing protein n=1 Tax=Exidia glandulosa HHB12029 TaxID=1314781 RepID=A0A165ETY5_EXIGL|nr:hypothetical protein EXIGLDRAFT_839780 [Exidia glandulosa HHB12029]